MNYGFELFYDVIHFKFPAFLRNGIIINDI